MNIQYTPVIQALNQARLGILSTKMLPSPRFTILIDFEAIIKAFQDVRFIGVLRQRWEEIRKLQDVQRTSFIAIR